MASRHTYKVIFHNQGKVYEIYARNVHQSAMYGFVEVEKLVFGEKSTVVLDPSEEHLKTEFSGVSRVYVPYHAIIRIDEVDKTGTGKVTDASGDKITPLPFFGPGTPKKP
ncbi:MAG: DUF1820 family protein [Gammaproteobacteria bacterium]